MSGSIEIRKAGDLYHRYSGQSDNQDCYIELDCERRVLRADYNGEIGNAVPFAVWHGHVQRWTIPVMRSAAADALLAEIAPLAERVCDGYDTEWDGNNTVAAFDDDAQEAIDAIETACNAVDDSDAIVAWEADEWLASDPPVITAATTDEELDALAAQLRAEALSEDVDELNGLDEYLRDRRARAQEDEAP